MSRVMSHVYESCLSPVNESCLSPVNESCHVTSQRIMSHVDGVITVESRFFFLRLRCE